MQKELVSRALTCALQAVKVNSNNATAHACAAVCYAKSCAGADIKTELAYSRLFKLEAEKTIALDPRQDIAYYLLGRWNYGVANMGMVSWAFVKVVYGGLPKASNAEAIANFKKAIALAPERIMHHAGLAMVYETTGDKKLELEELKKCCALRPVGHEDEDAQREAEKKLAALRP
jgi:tetratricopeptide (TPR) repeat protein